MCVIFKIIFEIIFLMNIDQLKSEIEQLKEEKYFLLKIINHDIRSPFNRVFALLQLFELESGNAAAQQKEYINSMYFSILSGLEMIQNLRDMREIDAGRITADQHEFNLINMIRKAIRTYSKQIELKQLNIETDLPANELTVITDEYLLQRVVESVLSNAVKFSKKDKDITVRLSGEKGRFFIEIQDLGEGIKKAEEHLLFEKFKKGSAVATGGEGSLGLGLYNARFFIKQLRGDLRLNRNNKPGTSFIISFPVE